MGIRCQPPKRCGLENAVDCRQTWLKDFALNPPASTVLDELKKKKLSVISIGKIALKYNMSKSKIHYILNNKIYMGVYNYNGKKEKNKISFKVPPIVSNYIWNKANSINNKL